MATEVERQQKLVHDLQNKRIDLDTKLNRARQRKSVIDLDQQALLAKLAGGDEGARKSLRRIEADGKDNAEDLQAFTAALASNATALRDGQKALALAEDEASIDQLEGEMSTLNALDAELQKALGLVSEKSGALIAAINSVGKKLAARDERTWGRFGEMLATQVRSSIWRSFTSIGVEGAPRSTFSQAVERDLRCAVAELRFASNGRRMPVKRGQHLYRALTQIGGLADIDSKPGDVVSLDPHDSQTHQWLREKSIELVDEQHEAVAAKEDARAAA
jgi:hypothetical protein